jgi:hypothetical protein
MKEYTLSQEQVESAFEEIDELAQAEYGVTLERLLELPMAEERLRRLGGVILKMPFATSTEPDSYNPTGSRQSWNWEAGCFEDPGLVGTEQYQLLEQLRDAQGSKSWDELRSIPHEADLMWVLGKWLKGRLAGEEKTFRDYYYRGKSPEENLALNAVDLLPVASVLADAVGVPVLAVSLALIVTQFGYEKLTESPMPVDS